MPSGAQPLLLPLPMPLSRWWAMALPAALAVVWLLQERLWGALLAALVVPLMLAVGQKVEVDGPGRRLRAGHHWAHMLNPPWERLPAVQRVVVKPFSYRQRQRRPYSTESYSGDVWRGFTVLLSVPGSAQGVVVASVTDEAQAEEIAVAVAGALQVPWQRA